MFKFFTIKNTGIFEVNKNENTNSRSIGEIRFVKLLASIATAIFNYFPFLFLINQQTSKPLTYQPFSVYGSLVFLAPLKSKR